jgi:hypothetical protein
MGALARVVAKFKVGRCAVARARRRDGDDPALVPCNATQSPKIQRNALVSLKPNGAGSGRTRRQRAIRGRNAGGNFDTILVGYYEGHELMSVAMVHGGFTPALQDSVFKRDDALETLLANHLEFAPLAILYSFSTCNAVSTRAGASPSPPASRCR